MEILVLLKQTFDTEAKIAVKNGRIAEDDVTYVINPYDEYAVEEGLKLRDANGGAVTVLSVGPDRVEEALRRALAMGADEAVLIEPPAGGSDERATAHLLADWAKQKSWDIVLAGNVSVDTGAGQTALRFAEIMGIPHVAAALKLELAGGKATVHRDAEGDTEVIEVSLPALITAQQGLNEPRYPSVPGIMKAKRKTIARVAAGEHVAASTETTSVFQAQQNRRNTIVKGSPAEQAKQLVQLLRGEAKVV